MEITRNEDLTKSGLTMSMSGVRRHMPTSPTENISLRRKQMETIVMILDKEYECQTLDYNV